VIRTWLFKLLFGVGFLIALWFVYPRIRLYWTLYQMHQAIQQQDSERFFTYVDRDSVSQAFLTAFFNLFTSQQEQHSHLPPTLYHVFENPTKEAIVEYMKQCIDAGKFISPNSLLLLPYYTLFYDSTLVYDSFSIHGGWRNSAVVTLILVDKRRPDLLRYPIGLRFVRMQNRWIWIGFDNLESFLYEMLKRKNLEEKPQA